MRSLVFWRDTEDGHRVTPQPARRLLACVAAACSMAKALTRWVSGRPALLARG
ncbi:hypothetical protein AB0H88_27240 [Nonomuraea sp. NPDC050680]|uniref:hypothetical protein n=1 Tax=Nonomuraea sp. NPDC050680 TaxID=3154630 RepID=UPI0034112566